MEKKNICRAITLYNNFLPADTCIHTWEYCAFGVVDGIDISQDIVLNDKQIPNCIWKVQSELTNKLMGKYAAQQVYILKYDFPKKEAEFWELDNEYPFIFFLRVQCGEDKECLYDEIEVLEKRLQIEEQIKVSIYLTFDNSDLFILLRSKLYEQGAGMVDTLHLRNYLPLANGNVCTIKNSFTIFALNHSFIEDNENTDFLKKKFIDEVFIKIIEKENGKVLTIEKELKKRKENFINGNYVEIRRDTIFGADDDLISIKNISWFDFISLYRKEGGIFCNCIPVYYENIAGATTIIKTRLEDYSNYFDNKSQNAYLQEKEIEEKKLGRIYKEQIESLSRKLRHIENQASGFEGFKELKLILNVLPKFAGEIFNDYIFFPIISPLNALLDLIECQKGKVLDNRYFFDFLKGFSMYVQGSVRTDRYSMQVMDFNTKIYDIPCKLNAFYCAFIYNVKKVLGVPKDNEDKPHIYEFLTVPGMTSFPNVVELYQKASPELRLMRVEIPERSFYNIHEMMIILAHEMAHYVGGKYRNRKERQGIIISSYAYIYIIY